MKRAMALATRVECNEESNVFGSKSNGNEGGRQLTATRVMVTATAMMLVMVMVTRLAGDGWQQERRRLNSRTSLSQPCLPYHQIIV